MALRGTPCSSRPPRAGPASSGRRPAPPPPRPILTGAEARRFTERGAHVLDAPVSGGKEGAENRNLGVMVGGPREIFDRVRPVLDAFSDKVFYAGAIGAGSVAKLVHNMIGH